MRSASLWPEVSIASCPSEPVTVARPTGVGRALTTYRIPIEGRDEWVAAAGVQTA